MAHDPSHFLGAVKIFRAYCKELNDEISMMCFNKSFNKIECRRNFNEADTWKAANFNFMTTENIHAVEVHDSLPLVAYHMKQDN